MRVSRQLRKEKHAHSWVLTRQTAPLSHAATSATLWHTSEGSNSRKTERDSTGANWLSAMQQWASNISEMDIQHASERLIGQAISPISHVQTTRAPADSSTLWFSEQSSDRISASPIHKQLAECAWNRTRGHGEQEELAQSLYGVYFFPLKITASAKLRAFSRIQGRRSMSCLTLETDFLCSICALEAGSSSVKSSAERMNAPSSALHPVNIKWWNT